MGKSWDVRVEAPVGSEFGKFWVSATLENLCSEVSRMLFEHGLVFGVPLHKGFYRSEFPDDYPDAPITEAHFEARSILNEPCEVVCTRR